MPGSGNRNSPLDGLSALALVGQLGLIMAVSIVGGVVVGSYLDRLIGGHGLLLAGGILLGIGGGIAGVAAVLVKEIPWKR
jgi:di/tricarboxylate transporter